MVKYSILHKLEENRDTYVSGECLSEIFGISRTSVWKHIRNLKKEGYLINASSKKGYKFTPASDILNTYEILGGLKTEFIGRKLLFFDSLDSTSNYARKIASEGCENGTVVAAETQTRGRGRMGREWASTPGKGIWLSVVLKPSAAPEEVLAITLAAAVSVVSAIKKATGIEAGIKWPNDIILSGRKVCGILTEMVSEAERVDFIVIGIGINVNQDLLDFPMELREKAISLKLYSQKPDSNKNDLPANEIHNRSGIIRELLYELELAYKKINAGMVPEIISDWRLHSVTLGREVKVAVRNMEYKGIARDIENDGRLVIECLDGTIRRISSGEVFDC
jgi:BirA family transcriptional regulator, biotin operon repressor / biotin---[acetyl-CoA-carboxylase] ligase